MKTQTLPETHTTIERMELLRSWGMDTGSAHINSDKARFVRSALGLALYKIGESKIPEGMTAAEFAKIAVETVQAFEVQNK